MGVHEIEEIQMADPDDTRDDVQPAKQRLKQVHDIH
jgi:hypothetical protein